MERRSADHVDPSEPTVAESSLARLLLRLRDSEPGPGSSLRIPRRYVIQGRPRIASNRCELGRATGRGNQDRVTTGIL